MTTAPAITSVVPARGSPARGMVTLGTGLTACGAVLSSARRDAGRMSLENFIRIYLSHHTKCPFSRMHREVFTLVESATRNRCGRLAIAAPRGHAKSTLVTLAYALWSMLYGHEPYILILSETAEQAAMRLSEIRAELESNAKLREDFPNACIIPPAAIRAVRWRKNELITGSGCRMTALGVDSKIRGRKHQEHRPNLIILDDVESEIGTRNPEQRTKLAEWFNRAVLKAGSPDVSIVVVGTILHFDSLLGKLVNSKQSPGWTGKVYQAVESFSRRPDLWKVWEDVYAGRAQHEGADGADAAMAFYQHNRAEMLLGTQVLWPEREDYLALMIIRLREGRSSFDAEKQNSPSGDRDALFRRDELVYWDDKFKDEQELLAFLGPDVDLYAACDPSLGKQGAGGDDTAIVVMAWDSTNKIGYVLDADIRRRKPREIIQALIELQKFRRLTYLVVETNQFQEFLADEVRRCSKEAGVHLPVWSLNHSTDKFGRIQSLEPPVRAGRLRFCRRHTTLLEQMEQFPSAQHDDGPDALEMVYQMANSRIEMPEGQFFY